MSIHFSGRMGTYLRLSAGVLSAVLWLPGAVTAQIQDAMALEIPVLPEAQRYITLLEYPPYLVLALDNIGVKLTGSGKITIPGPNSLQYKGMVLRYVHRNGSLYTYEASLNWGIGTLPIEADLSNLDKGKINVRIFLPAARLLPQDLINRIQLKVRNLADVSVQRKILAYLDDLQKKTGSAKGMDAIFNLILVQAYNNQAATIGSFVSGESEDAGPLSDRLLIPIMLILWLVIVPLVVAGPYLWRKYLRRS
jgi:hypothetical protein